MHPATSDGTSTPAPSPPASDIAPAAISGDIDPNSTQRHNFVVMVIYQVVLRMGWIFKTESVIMPAVMDSMGGAGWLRGCLPMVSRFGQSIPPLTLARQIKITPHKKWVLAICTWLMSASFLALAVIWFYAASLDAWWMPTVFLVVYAFFFVNTGVTQIAYGTLTGKLVPVERRGRLLWHTSIFGGIVSIAAALLLLRIWLQPTQVNFTMIFGFAGLSFAASAISAMYLREHPDAYDQPRHRFIEHFTNAAMILRDDANFRRLALVAALFGSSIMLFPHYQALGRERLSLNMDSLLWFIVVQNVGISLFGLPAGILADRFGNRLVLLLALIAVCVAPMAALALAANPASGRPIYFIVFFLVGLTPVTIRVLTNYTLEISDPQDHPRYLGTIGLCLALPAFLSPLAGYLIDVFDFEPVFIGITALIVASWLLTFTLKEPRHPLPASAITTDANLLASGGR